MACQDRSVLRRADERSGQDGEIVGSRHPDADAKPCGGWTARRRWLQAGTPRRGRI